MIRTRKAFNTVGPMMLRSLRCVEGLRFPQTRFPIAALAMNYYSSSESEFVLARPWINFDNVVDFNDAQNLFDKMLQMKPKPSVFHFTKLLRIVVEMEHYDSGVLFLKKMRFVGLPVNDETMNIEIDCYCHLNQVGCGFAILASFFKSGFLPNLDTFSTLIDGLILADGTPEAVELYKKLIGEKVCEPNEVMDGMIFDGLCNTGNTTKAIALLNFLQKGDSKPSIVSYNMVIDGLCKDGMVDDALNLLAEMIGKGILPNVVTHNSLIQGLCKSSRWNEIVRIGKEMGVLGVSPNQYTFTILVEACCKEGKIEEAESLIQRMIQIGMDPDVVTYSAVIDGHFMQGKVDKATGLLNVMMDKAMGIAKRRKWTSQSGLLEEGIHKD